MTKTAHDLPTADDIRYMRRALQLAHCGEGEASPNPMVGAVIVAGGRIIGEGFHRRCGEPHAEVNAVGSVADRSLLPQSTLYVTLEPCSHYGKTPPCAKLVIDSHIPRVVVATRDPFERVSGRGIAMMRDAGIDVVEGVLADECRKLNGRFMTAHTLHRPFITLKWAQSSDGFIGIRDRNGNPHPAVISNPLSSVFAHRERVRHDAIMVGTNTVISDNPRLDARLWAGKSPIPVTIDRHGSIPKESALMHNRNTLVYGDITLVDILSDLYTSHSVTSLLVEGGAKLLGSFIAADLWDEIRRETSSSPLGDGIAAPELPASAQLTDTQTVRNSRIEYFGR